MVDQMGILQDKESHLEEEEEEVLLIPVLLLELQVV
jgi:hypothetical protein